ncbi:unnamed protein product, partial [Choristocarpus tenellus]
STGSIRRNGGEFMDSGTKESYLRASKNSPKINLQKSGGFLNLTGTIINMEQESRASAARANQKQRLTLKDWHNILGHINPSAIKHLEKRGLLEITDATVASELQCETCKECKSEALSYQRGGRTPKQPGEVVHTDWRDHQYFQVFVDESSRDKRVYGLKTKNAATDATAAYIDQMAREGIPVKCISGDGAGELGRSVKFQRMMLANNGTRWRKSPPRTPQSNGIAERAIKQLMGAARSQLVKAGLGDEY